MTSAAEQKEARLARLRWRAEAVFIHTGCCERCGRVRDEEGSLLVVARRKGERHMLCFDCTQRKGRS